MPPPVLRALSRRSPDIALRPARSAGSNPAASPVNKATTYQDDPRIQCNVYSQWRAIVEGTNYLIDPVCRKSRKQQGKSRRKTASAAGSAQAGARSDACGSRREQHDGSSWHIPRFGSQQIGRIRAGHQQDQQGRHHMTFNTARVPACTARKASGSMAMRERLKCSGLGPPGVGKPCLQARLILRRRFGAKWRATKVS